MNHLLTPAHEFLAFVKSYCWLPLMVFVTLFGASYRASIHRAAWSDIRNPGADFLTTMHLANVIQYERRLNRNPWTMAYRYGVPFLIALLLLSLIFG